MLSELVDLLEIFEWSNNEFQSNKVSSSRVYPTVMAVKHKLSIILNVIIIILNYAKET